MEWTQAQTGDKLGYSESLISGIETMDKPPTSDFAIACDREFHTPGTFATLQALVAREAYPAFFAPVVGFEQEAIRIHGWLLNAIPGLLQTEEYARALIRMSRPMESDVTREKDVVARMERKSIFGKERPPDVWFILDESALHHVIGGPAVMGAQLDAVLQAASQPGIVIQVLAHVGEHPGTDGPISIYEFAGKPSVGYTECYAGGRIVEAQDEVAGLVGVMNLLRAAALPASESRALIARIRSELE